MPPKGITLAFATELKDAQIKQLKQLIIPYSKHQEYSKPIKINPKNKNRLWICALNRKKEVIGFFHISIQKKNRVIKALDSYVKPEYRKKGIRNAMLVRTIALARGLGRYSIKLNWLDSETSLKVHQNFARKLKSRLASNSSRRKFFAAGLKARKLTKSDKKYLIAEYGKGSNSFKKAIENHMQTYPEEPVFKKGGKHSISDGWIQMKQHSSNKKSSPPGPKKFGKTLFTPKGFRKPKPK